MKKEISMPAIIAIIVAVVVVVGVIGWTVMNPSTSSGPAPDAAAKAALNERHKND